MSCGDVEQNPGPWRDDYQVDPLLATEALRALGCATPLADLFCRPHNCLFGPFPGHPDAFNVSWRQLGPLWANPPFDLFPRVTSKIEEEGGHLVVICPGWRRVLRALWRPSFRQYEFPPGQIFLFKGRYRQNPPSWTVWALFINYSPHVGSYGPRPPPIPAHAFLRPNPPPMAPLAPDPSPLRPTTTLFDLSTRKPRKRVRFLATPDIIPTGPVSPTRHIPVTGRGFSLVSTGIEQNPGPAGPAAGNI